jgi:integrase
MSAKSISSAASRKASSKKEWTPPYPDFPLSYHPPSGRLYKTIRCRRFYFGYGRDWQAAIEKYQHDREARYAGREPEDRVTSADDPVTVAYLCNHFLTNKQELVDTGELTPRTFTDYKSTTDRLVRVFGKNRSVESLSGLDFGKLRADIAKTRGPVSLKNEMVRVKCVFNFGFKDELFNKVRYGARFEAPKKKVIRKANNAKGSRMFEANELRTIIKAADIHLRAMILVAANSGMGNHDIGCLPIAAVNLDSGWVVFPREKTGAPRRFPMWEETVEAIRASLTKRPEPKPGHEQYLFLTRKRQCWSKNSTGGALSREFKKLLVKTGIYRDGLGFYGLRRGFQTIGEEAGETATKLIMGHMDDDMAAQYRQRIANDRLKAVCSHVRAWLYADPDGKEPAEETNFHSNFRTPLRLTGRGGNTIAAASRELPEK